MSDNVSKSVRLNISSEARQALDEMFSHQTQCGKVVAAIYTAMGATPPLPPPPPSMEHVEAVTLAMSPELWQWLKDAFPAHATLSEKLASAIYAATNTTPPPPKPKPAPTGIYTELAQDYLNNHFPQGISIPAFWEALGERGEVPAGLYRAIRVLKKWLELQGETNDE